MLFILWQGKRLLKTKNKAVFHIEVQPYFYADNKHVFLAIKVDYNLQK